MSTAFVTLGHRGVIAERAQRDLRDPELIVRMLKRTSSDSIAAFARSTLLRGR